jgi:hypothetical protein
MNPSLRVTRLPERVAEPLKTLIKTITGRGTSGLDVLRRISFDPRVLKSFGENLPRRAVSSCAGPTYP